MVINKINCKIVCFAGHSFSLKFVGTLELFFFSSIISLHVITKSSIILFTFNNTLFTIFTTLCSRSPHIIFIVHIIFFWIYNLKIDFFLDIPVPNVIVWFELHILLSNLQSYLHDISFFNVLINLFLQSCWKGADLNFMVHLGHILY